MTIKANHEQQAGLLALAELDQAIARLSANLKVVEADVEAENLRRALLEGSEALLAAHGAQERIQTEIDKLNADVDLVVERIHHDETRIKQVNNDRELKAIEQELSSLSARKSNLEDAEFELLEELESGKALLEDLTQKRATLSLELEGALERQHAKALGINSQLTKLVTSRAASVAKLTPELAALYERKAQRGIAVSQTLGRDCSACRLAINGVEFDAMLSLPVDEIPLCPNCDAMIIR